MSRMGRRNVPDVRSLATQPPYILSERVLGEVLHRCDVPIRVLPQLCQQYPGALMVSCALRGRLPPFGYLLLLNLFTIIFCMIAGGRACMAEAVPRPGT